MIYKTLHIINEHLRFKQNTNKQTKQKKTTVYQLLPSIGRKPFSHSVSCCLVLGRIHSASTLVIAQYWEEAIQPIRQLLPSVGRKPFSQYVSCCLVLGGSHSASTLVVAQCWEGAIQPVRQLLLSNGRKPFSKYVKTFSNISR